MTTCVYLVEFIDGKRATALDMTGTPLAEQVRGLVMQFQPGYVVRITPSNGEPLETDQIKKLALDTGGAV